MSTLGPAVPGIRETFGLSLGEVGSLQALSAVGYLVSVFAGGVVADRLGARPVLLTGAGGLIAGIGVFVGASAWPLVVLGSTLLGVGCGLIDGTVNALVSEHSGTHRGADLNLTHGFFGLGAVLSPLVAGLLLTAGLGWRWLYVPGVLAAVVLFAVTWRLDLGPRRAVVADERPTLAVLAAPVVSLLALVLCLYVGVEMTVATWAFSHLQAAFAAGDAIAGGATALYWGGITLGLFVMGSIGARFSAHQLIVGNVVGTTIALGLMVAAPSLPLAVLGLALIGLSLANIFPAAMAVAGEAYPRAVGTVMGALIAAGGVGGALFPWLTGVAAERTGLGPALAGGLALLLVMLVAERAIIALERRERRARLASG